MFLYQQQIEDGVKISRSAVKEAILEREYDVLYFALESQIGDLVSSEEVSEDISSMYQNYQEEMRCLMDQL